jgi:hypothetical protein
MSAGLPLVGLLALTVVGRVVPPHLFMVLIDDLGYHNGNPILALLFSPILNVSASTQVHCFHGTTSCTQVLGTVTA